MAVSGHVGLSTEARLGKGKLPGVEIRDVAGQGVHEPRVEGWVAVPRKPGHHERRAHRPPAAGKKTGPGNPGPAGIA